MTPLTVHDLIVSGIDVALGVALALTIYALGRWTVESL